MYMAISSIAKFIFPNLPRPNLPWPILAITGQTYLMVLVLIATVLLGLLQLNMNQYQQSTEDYQMHLLSKSYKKNESLYKRHLTAK